MNGDPLEPAAPRDDVVGGLALRSDPAEEQRAREQVERELERAAAVELARSWQRSLPLPVL